MYMRNKFILFIFLLASLVSFSQINSGNPTIPFGSNTSYDYGMIPTNLPTGGTFGASRHAADAYNAFKSTYIVNCGNNAARVRFDNVNETVSEGIAYAMLLSAYAADQNTLDRLWQYYKNHMNDNGVMHWKINGCNTVTGFNGATDAELDAAMALIVADKQWGSSGNAHNYKNDAVDLITAIAWKEVNLTDKTFLNGDAWGDNGGCRNPSYQAPAYARAFTIFMTENAPSLNQGSFWTSVAGATSNLLTNNANRTPSGLASNWSKVSGQPDNSCQGSGTAAFSFGYDACRAPWRQGTDYLWWGSESDLQVVVNKQIDFWIGKGGASQVQGGDGFNQNGSGNGDHNGAFTGMIGAQSLAASTSTAHQNLVNALYNQNRNSNAPQYFTAILKVIGLFVQTGNFWNPFSATITGGNAAPSVSLSTPSSNYSTCLGVDIPLVANANDSDGNISKVEFLNGNTLLFSDNSAPYRHTITNATAGVLTITAKAYDNEGAVKTSSVREITVSSSVSSNGSTCDDIMVSEDFHAAVDEFDQVANVQTDGTGNTGIFWFVGEPQAGSASNYSINRTANGMVVNLTDASPDFQVFGASFGMNQTINLKDFSNADIKLNVRNNATDDINLSVQLQDIDGNVAEIEIDNPNDIEWNTNPWKKIGIQIPKGQTVNRTINLSGDPNRLGGFTAVSWGCGSAVECPVTSYDIDVTKISSVVFIVNGGAGTTDNANDAVVSGELIFNHFSIGETSNGSSNVIEQGDVVSNPDSDNDGISDGNDLCAGTPSGQPVNSQGCAASQLDSDNDGVKDDRDDCPNSLPGENVDANGCKVNAIQSAKSLGINIFPNPAENTLFINQETLLMTKLSIRSISGTEVFTKDSLIGSDAIDLSSLSKGVYLIILNGPNGVTQERVVVK